MKTSIKLKFVFVLALLLAQGLDEAESRGGRGRGGGGTLSLFGGLRKYKKQNSYRSSRKITNGSPMHTAITTGDVKVGGSNRGLKGVKSSSYGVKSQSNVYPKQSAFPRNVLGESAREMPPGSTYYAQASSIPSGAIFYTQPPRRSESGDFLFGMLAGNLLTRAMFGSRTHVSQVHNQGESNNEHRIIIINNNFTNFNETADNSAWENNASVAESFATTEASGEDKEEQISDISLNATYGIVCMPFWFNQTNSEDPSLIESVERIACFPAPPPSYLPPPPGSMLPNNPNCILHNVEEENPNKPGETILVQKQECFTEEPIQIAGEILEGDDDDEDKEDLEGTSSGLEV